VLLVRNLKLSAAPRIIKEKHVCLPLGKTAAGQPLSAMGWSRTGRTSWAERIAGMALEAGTTIDIVGRLRENTHPQFGGIELELVDIAFPAQRTELSIA
jgi:single-stranded-DNA-specific exonuclease